MSERSSTRTDDEPAIVAEGVVKMFRGGVRALDGIGFAIPAGELVALIGANGSGKSTLLKVLFGVIEADAGSVSVLGMHPRRDRAALSTRTGYAGQDTALDPEITGRETIRLFYALRGLPAPERGRRIEEIIEEYELGPFCDRRVGTYSGGQRQRLHLALETMHAPSLLLLDEPTSSLDPEGRRRLWRWLAEWRDGGRTIVVSTHDLPDIASRCDRVLLLQGGHLLASDSPGSLIAAYGRARAVITLERPPGDEARGLRRELVSLPGALDAALGERTVTIWRDRHPDGAEPALDILSARGIHYQRYERLEPDLAEAYFHMTGSPLESGEPSRQGGRGGGNRGGGGRGGNRRG